MGEFGEFDPMEWQKRFREAPMVWVVQDRDGTWCEVYDSEEAAAEFMAFAKRAGWHGYRAIPTNVHTLALSRERWGAAAQPKEVEGAD